MHSCVLFCRCDWALLFFTLAGCKEPKSTTTKKRAISKRRWDQLHESMMLHLIDSLINEVLLDYINISKKIVFCAGYWE
jgi:hypothetical protein